MIITTDFYWDCECEEQYIHSNVEESCPKCNAKRDESSQSRVNEVMATFKAEELDEIVFSIIVTPEDVLNKLGWDHKELLAKIIKKPELFKELIDSISHIVEHDNSDYLGTIINIALEEGKWEDGICSQDLVDRITKNKCRYFEASMYYGDVIATHTFFFGGRKLYDTGIDSEEVSWFPEEFVEFYKDATWWEVKEIKQ